MREVRCLMKLGMKLRWGFFVPCFSTLTLYLASQTMPSSQREGGEGAGGRGAGGSEKNNENEKKIGVGGKS